MSAWCFLVTDEKLEATSKCPMLTECPFQAEHCAEDDDCSPDSVCCKAPCGKVCTKQLFTGKMITKNFFVVFKVKFVTFISKHPV